MARDVAQVERLADVLVEQRAALDALKAAAEALADAEMAVDALRTAFLQAKTNAESVTLRLAGLVQRDTEVIPAPSLLEVQKRVALKAEEWKRPKGG